MRASDSGMDLLCARSALLLLEDSSLTDEGLRRMLFPLSAP